MCASYIKDQLQQSEVAQVFMSSFLYSHLLLHRQACKFCYGGSVTRREGGGMIHFSDRNTCLENSGELL